VHKLCFQGVWTFGVKVLEFQRFLWIGKWNEVTFYFEKFITFALGVQMPWNKGLCTPLCIEHRASIRANFMMFEPLMWMLLNFKGFITHKKLKNNFYLYFGCAIGTGHTTVVFRIHTSISKLPLTDNQSPALQSFTSFMCSRILRNWSLPELYHSRITATHLMRTSDGRNCRLTPQQRCSVCAFFFCNSVRKRTVVQKLNLANGEPNNTGFIAASERSHLSKAHSGTPLRISHL